MDGESTDKIINETLENEHDEKRKKIILFLFEKATNRWPWTTSKRFFIYGNDLCFPNGCQAKENTDIIENYFAN